MRASSSIRKKCDRCLCSKRGETTSIISPFTASVAIAATHLVFTAEDVAPVVNRAKRCGLCCGGR